MLFGIEAHQSKERFLAYYDGEKNQEGKTLLTRRAIDFKRELKKKGLAIKDNYADEETLQILAKAKKCDIIVYDNVYNEKWRLKKHTSNPKMQLRTRGGFLNLKSKLHFSFTNVPLAVH